MSKTLARPMPPEMAAKIWEVMEFRHPVSDMDDSSFKRATQILPYQLEKLRAEGIFSDSLKTMRGINASVLQDGREIISVIPEELMKLKAEPMKSPVQAQR